MTDVRMQWLQRLRTATLEAFPDRADLEQQLWFQLGIRLDEISSEAANLQTPSSNCSSGPKRTCGRRTCFVLWPTRDPNGKT